MPRSRPASNPLSFHKPTGQYYVTRGGRRIYLGTDREAATEKYHRLALDVAVPEPPPAEAPIFAKDLANRFLAAQEANWRNPRVTLKCYRDWLGRFLTDHPKLMAGDLTVERFAAWKLSLRRRGYAAESINHYLSAVRAMYTFADDSSILNSAPRLKRIKNERPHQCGSAERPLYTAAEIRRLLDNADVQLKAMILLALNCGFGPKDLHDLKWSDIRGERVTLPRSKTGVSQTFLLWAETQRALDEVRQARLFLVERLKKRGRHRSDDGYVFVTYFWRAWKKDSIAEQFRKLCKVSGVPCYGIYRLRHCASTAMSLVANPHVHRKFMRHSQLQQQVAYTHTPDVEVDTAVEQAKAKLLPSVTEDSGNDHGQAEVA